MSRPDRIRFREWLPHRVVRVAAGAGVAAVAGLRRRVPRRVGRAAAAFGIAATAAMLAVAGWIALPLPGAMARPAVVPSLVVQDRHGLTLRTTRAEDGSRGGWIPLADVDAEIIHAFVAAEDRRYFEHRGVDLRAIARAARDNLAAGRVVSGASTLTMQTARLLRPTGRSWAGKLAQALWALRLEAHLDKARILEQYLNRVPLGQGAVGIAAAARLYFGRSAADVSLGQAALLAALARAPSRDNPLVDPARARERRDRVLGRLAALGHARPDDVARAREEPVLDAGVASRFLAPHFTTRLLLITEAGATAARAHGAAAYEAAAPADGALAAADGAAVPMDGAPAPAYAAAAPRRIAAAPTGTWRTTLDLELQRELEAEARHAVGLLGDRGARHAAAVVLENRTGGILAWVGSPDFRADTAGQVDMVVSRRQPGSTLKPFLYGLAFDRGYTAATVLPDVPRTYSTAVGPYRPQNYDRRFRGPVRARVALASSLNVPAVELAARLGAGSLLATLREAGFVSLDRPADHYGLGLALGNGEVTLLELANAYRGLANGGVWRPVRWIETAEGPGASDGLYAPDGAASAVAAFTAAGRVADRVAVGGHPGAPARTAPPPAADGRRFLSEGATALVLDILADPVARIPGFGVETPLDFPFPTAAKTGTSRHFTDNWAVAVTGGFTVAVWVGDFSGRPMRGVSGVSGAGPLLYRAVLRTARRYAPGHLAAPERTGAVAVPVCLLSGLLATDECPSTVEWFLPGTEPTRLDDWQRGGRTVLPPEYAEWVAADAGGLAPTTGAGTGAAPAGAPTHRILSPRDGDVYERPVGVDPRYATIPLLAVGAGDVVVRWFVDGRRHPAARWRLETGHHRIRAEWASGRRDSVRVEVR